MRLLPLVALALAVPAAAEDRPASPGRNRSLQHYAETFGVTVEEAERRQQHRWAIVELDRRLEAAEPGTYAGLAKEHSPAYRVVVRFTADAEATLRRHTSDPLFVAAAAPLSLVALDREHEEAIRAMRATGIRYASQPDVPTGTIRVIVEDPAALETLRASGAVLLSPRVVVVQAAGPFPPLPPGAPAVDEGR
ncbi:MAG TPA: hypothetical protein VF759_12440 [Allosphingosinicella sp.]|jgi:hypothetical protein